MDSNIILNQVLSYYLQPSKVYRKGACESDRLAEITNMKILEKGKVNGFLLTTITPEEKSEDEARQIYRKLGNVLREYIKRIEADESKNQQKSKHTA